MKMILPAAVALLALSLFTSTGVADDTNAAAADLKALVTKVRTKLQEGKKTEADLAPELKEFDTLLDKYKGEKTDDVAQILQMKAMLYQQVLKDTEKGDALLAQLKRDYPDSEPVKMMKQQEEAKKLKAELAEGTKFPDFSEKDMTGKPLSIANYKGKVVLLDFWATWCGPCVVSVPKIIATYKKFHGKGFEIVGISLDRDKDSLVTFSKQRGMTWPQYFDGKVWENDISTRFHVNAIPATWLVDKKGYARPVEHDSLSAQVEKLLAE
jgi:thiol-disulfide isomerase/thioredoxin